MLHKQPLSCTIPMSLIPIKELHYTEFYPTLEQPNHTALVVFYSTRCTACRRIKDLIQDRPLSIPTYFLNATTAEGLVEEFSIFHLPTLILYKNGLFHRFFDPDLRFPLEEQIEKTLNLPSQQDPSC